MRYFALVAALALFTSNASANALLVDDFSTPGVSALGTRWQAFTDGVMGGRSQMNAGIVEDDGANVLRMVGTVSLENNGGFIQVQLPLAARGSFDASEYTGIAVETRGRPGAYFVHLRTRDTRRPWQHFKARIPVGAEWQRTVIPFDEFVPDSIRATVDAAQLTSLAIAAAGEAFQGDVSVRRIEFVP